MFRLNKASIAFRLTVLVICFSSMVAVVATAIQLYLDYRRDLQGLYAFFTAIEETSLRPIEESVWVLDDLQVNLQLEGLIKREGIVHAVVEMNGEVAWQKGDPTAGKSTITRTFPLLHQVRNGKELIGQLRVVASRHVIYDRLLDRIVILLISNTLKTFLVSGFILLLFQKQLTRHLIRLADFVRKIDLRHTRPMPLVLDRPPSRSPDEIDQVVSVLNELCMGGYLAFDRLQAQEERLRLFFDAAGEAVFGVDIHGVCTFVNRAGLEYFQETDQGALIGRNLLALIEEQGRLCELPCTLCVQVRATLSESRVLETEDVALHRSDGTALRVSLRSYPVLEHGCCVGAIVFFSDISRQQQLEQEKLLFARVIRQAPALILITNAVGVIEYGNASLEKVFAQPAATVLGKEAVDCFKILGFAPDIQVTQVQNAVRDGKAWAGRFTFTNAAGKRISLEMEVLPITNQGCALEHIMILGRDVTREQELLEQLQHAQKMETIGKLASSIAHEFGNPLLGIRFALREVKQRPGLDAEARNMLRLAEEECDRMRKLLRDLQRLNRPSSSRTEPCDLHRLIENVLALHRNYLEKKRICVVRAYDGQNIILLAVEDQIRQVLVNLMLNASDAMTDQGGVLVISTAVQVGEAHISFEDTGPGIRQEHLERIFEPFFTTKAASEGTGLGLSVSYGIVRAHGGAIEVQSAAGKTVFTVKLPMRTTLEMADEAREVEA